MKQGDFFGICGFASIDWINCELSTQYLGAGALPAAPRGGSPLSIPLAPARLCHALRAGSGPCACEPRSQQGRAGPAPGMQAGAASHACEHSLPRMRAPATSPAHGGLWRGSRRRAEPRARALPGARRRQRGAADQHHGRGRGQGDQRGGAGRHGVQRGRAGHARAGAGRVLHAAHVCRHGARGLRQPQAARAGQTGAPPVCECAGAPGVALRRGGRPPWVQRSASAAAAPG